MGKLKINKNYIETKGLEVHGDIFDYSKVEYVKYETPFTVICKKCENEFQKDYNHFIQ